MFDLKVSRRVTRDAGDNGVVEHLTPQGGWSEDESEGLALQFRWPPMVSERLTIARKARESAGGFKALAEIDAEIGRLEDAVRDDVTQAFDSATAHKVLSGEAEVSALIAKMDELSGETLACLAELRATRAQIGMLAEWPVLFARGPADWSDIGEMALTGDVVAHVLVAWNTAKNKAEAELIRGNGRSSPS